jgi:Anti-sigma-K factor rskA
MSEPGPQGQPDEAMVDLLIKQVTEGLSPAEQRALDVMDSAQASAYLRDFERAAAAVTLAAADESASLPPHLAELVLRQAEQHFAAAAPPAAVVTDLNTARVSAAPQRPRANAAYGWLAAAACLVMAVWAWNRSPTLIAPPTPPPVAVVLPPPVVKPVPVVPPTLAEQRQALLDKSDSLKVTLGATKDPAAAGVSADVVWDEATQTGFIHVVGLAPNDPALHQYQLWIFDGTRDKRYPVDAGVFDVPADATEIIIPLRAALPVRTPAAFALTVEKAGGTVVSGREHVVALGAAS